MNRHFGLAFVLVIALFLPGTGIAQDAPQPAPSGADTQGNGRAITVAPTTGSQFGKRTFLLSGFPTGPRVAPAFGYPDLPGGPFVGYPSLNGRGAPNRLGIWGPPVPVYGPVPNVTVNSEIERRWRRMPSPGFPFGWFGLYPASPRPREVTVSVWAAGAKPGRTQTAAAMDPAKPGNCLTLAVKVSQASAEIFVDGVKTTQTGTDRTFESPPLENGKAFKYEVTMKWIEGGVMNERKKVATGLPGEVVSVDFTAPDVVVVAGK